MNKSTFYNGLYFLWALLVTGAVCDQYFLKPQSAYAAAFTTNRYAGLTNCYSGNLGDGIIYESQAPLGRDIGNYYKAWTNATQWINISSVGSGTGHPWSYSTCEQGDVMIGVRLRAGDTGGASNMGVDAMCCKPSR